MRNLLSISLISILLPIQLYSNGLFIKSHYGQYFHLTHENQTIENIPVEFQGDRQTIGLGQYYEDGNGFDWGIGYSTPNIDESNIFVSFFASYAKHSINATNHLVDAIFGHKLDYSTICLSVGAGRRIKQSYLSSRFIMSGGLLFNTVKGNSDLKDYRIVFDYESTTLFRVAANLEIPVVTPNQGISISATYDLGGIQRGKANYYQGTNWFARARPTGDLEISDNRFGIAVGVFIELF